MINVAYVGENFSARMFEVETMRYVFGNYDGVRVALVVEDHIQRLFQQLPNELLVIPPEMLAQSARLNMSLASVEGIPWLTGEIKAALVEQGIATIGMAIAARNGDIAHFSGDEIDDHQAYGMQLSLKERVGWPGVDMGIVEKAYTDSGIRSQTEREEPYEAPEEPADDLSSLPHIGKSAANKLAEQGVTTFEQVAAQTPDSMIEVIGGRMNKEKATEAIAAAKASAESE